MYNITTNLNKNNIMKHKHHIVPKHMGGTDNLENIIELTIEEHAEAHKLLWEEHGKKEDWLAWQGQLDAVKRGKEIGFKVDFYVPFHGGFLK